MSYQCGTALCFWAIGSSIHWSSVNTCRSQTCTLRSICRAYRSHFVNFPHLLLAFAISTIVLPVGHQWLDSSFTLSKNHPSILKPPQSNSCHYYYSWTLTLLFKKLSTSTLTCCSITILKVSMTDCFPYRSKLMTDSFSSKARLIGK